MNDPLGLFDEGSAQDPLGLFDAEEEPSFIKGLPGAIADLGLKSVGTAVSGLAMIPHSLYMGVDEAVKRHEERMNDTWSPINQNPDEKYAIEQVGKGFEHLRQGMINTGKTLINAIPGFEDPENPHSSDNDAELASTLGTDLFLNFLPAHQIGRAVKESIKPVDPSISKLPGADKIAKLNEKPPVEAVKPEVVQPELDLFSPDQKQLGRSPYDATPKERWAVDENGIPYKPRLSEDVQRMEVPEQTHLFPIDEQAPVDRYTFNKRAEEQKAQYEEQLQRQNAESEAVKSREIEQAYKERELGKKQAERDLQQTRIEDALIDLENVLREERVSKGSKRKDMRRTVSRSQRGAIDVEAFGMPKDRESAQRLYDDLLRRAADAGYKDEQLNEAKWQAALNLAKFDIDAKKVEGLKNQKLGEVAPGYTHIPEGTYVTARHGIKYSEPTRGKVIGTKNFRSADGPYRLPIVDFGDGEGRAILPGDITEVHRPKAAVTQLEPKIPVGEVIEGAPTDIPGLEVTEHFGDRPKPNLVVVPKNQRGAIDFSSDPRLKDTWYKLKNKSNLNSKEQAFLRALAKEDNLGFDTPQQAIQAIIEDPVGSHPITPALKTAITNLIHVPKNQRGGIDVRAIAQAMEPDDLPTREVKLNDPVKAIGDLPGNKGIGKSYISPDPEPKDIIREAMSGKDSDLKVDSVQSGATLTGMIHKSPLIRGVASLYQNATKRAELVTRQLIEPTEKKFKTLPKNELEELGTLMKHEMTARKEYTLSELKEAGFSDKQIEAYTDMRAMFNKAWEAQNSALEAMGKKPLTKQEAYLSSRWEGNWRAPVYDKDGKLVFYIAERSKAGAQKALDYLKKNSGLELDMKKSKVEFKGQGAQRRGEVTDAYRTMLGILDSSDPRVATLKSIYEDGQMRGAFEALGQKRHFENKGNIRGFIGDRPWVKPGRDAVEMFQQQFQYAKAAFEWAELSKATTKAKEVLSNEQLLEQQPNNMRYAQSYAKTKLGFGGHAGVEAIEGSLSKFFGRDAQTAYDALGGLKSYFILSKLAISPGFWISNFVQPLWTSAWHADLTAQGYKHNLSKTMANAGSDASAAIANRIAEVTGQPYRAKLSELGTEALHYAEDNGIVNRNLTDENATLGQHPVAEFGQMLGQATIGNIEHVARLNAFMGFVHHLEQSGKFTDRMQLFKQAENLTNASMVDYRKGERPMIFDQTGLVGSAAASLQTFKFNYYNQLHYFWNQAKEGKWQGLAAFAGTQALVGGTLSMPFLQEIDDAWETFKKAVPDAVHLKIKDFTIKSEIIKNLPDLVAFGGLSKLTGADFTSRFDAGNIADFSLDGLFPFIADILKQGQAVGKAIANPNQTTLSQAAYQVAPPGPIQGAVETKLPAFQSSPGTYKNPNNLVEQDADYQRTPGQETYRQFGLRELGESKERYLRNRQRQNEAESSQRLREQSTKFVDAMVRQDPKDMKTYAYRYIQYGGNAEELNQIIERESLKMFLTKEQIEAAKATSLGAVQRVKRMRELLK